MKFTPRLFLQAVAGAILVSAAAIPAAGQQQQAPPPVTTDSDNVRREAERRAMERDRRDSQFILRGVEAEAHRQPTAPSGPRLDVQQILEDFKLLQVVSRDLLQATSGETALDLKLVEKSASEIRERATRLRSNLPLPRPEKDGKRLKPEVPDDQEELRRSLARLDELIVSFAHNPVFKEINVVDAELSVKARRDLDEIIELSEQVKKGSGQLRKAAQNSQ